jgi:hypothetical protein
LSLSKVRIGNLEVDSHLGQEISRDARRSLLQADKSQLTINANPLPKVTESSQTRKVTFRDEALITVQPPLKMFELFST